MTSRIFQIFVTVFLGHFSSITYAQISVKKMDSLYSVVKDINDADSSSLMINSLLKQTRANNYQSGTLSLLLLKAVNLYNSGKFDLALKETYEIEDEVRQSLDFAKASHLLALRANCYGNLFYFDKSNECLIESKKFADKIKDNDTRYVNLSRVYRLLATNIELNTSTPINRDSVMYYRKKSYNIQQLIVKTNLKQGLVIDASAIGHLFLDKGKIDSAKHYFLISQQLVKNFKLYKYGIEPTLGLGEIFERQNQTDSALAYYNIALKASLKGKRIGTIKMSYKLLSALHNKLGNKKLAQDYANKFGLITDSIANAHKKASTVTADYIIKDKESQYSRNKKQYLIIIFGSISFLIVLVFTIIKLRKNHKKTLLHQEKEHVALSKKFDDLQPDKLDEAILKEIVNLAKTNDPAFFAKFKEHHPIFIQKIMQHSPDMLSSDLSVCAKLKLGFNTKEIAYYDRSSQRAVESRKYRIRKKLGLTTDDDLATWVVNL